MIENKSITPAEARTPDSRETNLAYSIQSLADIHNRDGEGQISAQLGPRTVTGSLRNDAWTFEYNCPRGESKIILAQRSSLDENFNSQLHRDTILIGEKGTNAQGEQAYTSWRHVQTPTDFEMIEGIDATLSHTLE